MAKYVVLSLRARRFTTHIVCNHGESFWYRSQVSRGSDVEALDVKLYAIFIVGINIGLWSDEVSKLRTQNMSFVSGEIKFSISREVLGEDSDEIL